MEYRVWETVAVGNACMLDPIENVASDRNLTRGIAFEGAFPAAAQLRMSRRHKKDAGLTDDLANFDRMKVCSPRLVEFLRSRTLKNVEYLPVIILDHKGKVASKDYRIVHPVVLQDALDTKASAAVYSPLIKTEIDSVQRLVIDARRIDPEVKIFRLKAFFFPFIVEQALAAEMETEGFTGPYFQPLEEYGV